MAYDEGLAERVRTLLTERAAITEKRMFGGLAFLLRGNMCLGIVKRDLMVRVGPEAYARLVRRKGARPMDFTGRPMKGFLFVDGTALDRDADLERWVGYGVTYATSLSQKKAPGVISSRRS